MNTFFYKNWWLYYLLFFLLIGLLIYALLWRPNLSKYEIRINQLNQQLEDCRNNYIKTEKKANEEKSDSTFTNKIDCDGSVKSGGQGITTTQHELGNISGTVVIDYDMKKVPDEITVYYDDSIVAHSNGLVSGTGRLQFTYNAIVGKPTFCIVKLSAPNNDTRWDYLLNCPR